jgi:hypothetical protein
MPFAFHGARLHMADTPVKLDYASPANTPARMMVFLRVAIVAIGITLPYLARLPGMATKGADWLTSYFGSGWEAIAFSGCFNAINWGSILAASYRLRSPAAVVLLSLVGFALPAYQHATLDLASDAQAAIGLLFVPIYSLPFVWLGWFTGSAIEKIQREERSVTNG